MKKNGLMYLIAVGIPTAGLVWLLLTTTPDSVGPQGVLIFFGLILLLFTAITYGIVSLLRHGMSHLQKLELSLFIALGPLALLALTTLKQIKPVDIVLIVIFELFLIFYVRRGRIRDKNE